MVVRVKSTRFDLPAGFNRIIKGSSFLDELRECPDEEQPKWFSDEHRIPLKKILDRYGTSMTKGLETCQVIKNRMKYGSNVIDTKTKRGYTESKKVIKSFFFGLNTLIWICAILSLTTSAIIRQFYDGHSYGAELLFGAALILVTIVSGFSFYYQEYNATKIMEGFNNLVTHFAMVKRDGHFKEVFVDELVVGDIVKLTYGEVIPADIRLIECHEFFVDNSSLTGESDPKRRHSLCTDNDPMESKNLVFYSTFAVEGHAKGVVVAVGENTVMGKLVKLAGSVEVKKAKSPIVSEMKRFIKIISICSLVLGIIFCASAIALNYSWQDAVTFFTLIVVASIPEGLNLTCTMLLVMNAKTMAKKHCLVKNLHALEILASSAVMLTDKTGTLTQNKMSIAHLWFDDKFAEADTSEFLGEHDANAEGETRKKTFQKTDPGFKALARVARLCSRAKFKPMQADVPIFRREVNGDASEGKLVTKLVGRNGPQIALILAAILRFMETQFKNVKKYRSKQKILCEIPFNSRTRYQVFVHEVVEKSQTQHLATIKGAPEEVLKLCNRILVGDNEYPLTDEWRRKVEKGIITLGSVGERVIGFGDGILPPEKYNDGYIYMAEKPEFLNTGLRFVGLMSMIDPPRAAVPEAIRKCRSAGVRMVMVTGDHPTTAVAIGRVVGMITEGNETVQELSLRKRVPVAEVDPNRIKVIVVTGSELKRMDETLLNAIITSGKELIFARITPEQKFRLVEAFQKFGHFVGVIGDGVNDSPALRKSDIGISMGITGTEVSKAISDMILLDDNFSSIVNGIEEGRRAFENLKKILAYSLADNVAEMWAFVVCILLKIPLPLGTMAILLTVLGTDLFPALSLMYEDSETDVMKLKPRNHLKDKLITPELVTHIYFQVAILETVAGYFCYFTTMASYGFTPMTLIGIGQDWENRGNNDLQDSWGQEWTFQARKELEKYSQTAFFVTIVIMQIANVVICKTRLQSIFQKKMNNWPMNFSILVALGITCVIVYTPDLASFFGMVSLRATDWLLPLPFAILLLIMDELRRLYLRRMSRVSITDELSMFEF